MRTHFLPYGAHKGHSAGARFLATTFTLVTLAACAGARVDFDSCRQSVQNGSHGSTIGLDVHGKPVQNISLAQGVSYSTCRQVCGSGSTAFDWSTFSAQFNSWLIPWLALLSQLPLGGEDRFDNLMSVILAVGSPALAAYSLFITLLNNRWLATRIRTIKHQNAKHFVFIFFAFQQIPIELNTDSSLLASLIVLPQNHDWWAEMAKRTDVMCTWNVPAAVNTAWVAIAFIFTIVDSISDTAFAHTHGHAVAAVWVWLLPVVVGWLRVGSQVQAKSLRTALQHCNETLAHVATQEDPKKAGVSSGQHAITHDGAATRLHRDKLRAAPIYNYARVLPWTQSTEYVLTLFAEASRKTSYGMTVDGRKWVQSDRIDNDNTKGSAEQVMRYCEPPEPMTPHDHQYPPASAPLMPQGPALGRRWSLAVLGRMAVAVAAALFLQWSTTGAAMVMTILTPTVGLGCRSTMYLVYGTAATMSLFSLLISSLLAHAYQPSSVDGRKTWKNQRVIHALSIIFRWAGKTLATLNAFVIIVGCTMQFANIFSSCYCVSSVISLGKARAYAVFLTGADLIALGTRDIWMRGDAIAIAAATVFGTFVYIAAPSYRKYRPRD